MSDLLQTTTQETWLWVGTAGMAGGAVAIFATGRGLGRHAHHAVASFFVCAVAASLYLLMAQGQGDVVLASGQVSLTAQAADASAGGYLVYFARYIDWVVTTPLLLVGLLTVGLGPVKVVGDAARERTGLIAGVIGADILMILTGLFGALSVDSAHKYTWFAVSCVFFLAVLVVIWGPVRAAATAQGSATAALFGKLLIVLTGLWLIYPVLWILGTEGTSTITLDTEVAVFTVIDLLAKVGFGLILVTGVKRLHAATPGDHTIQSPAATTA